MEHTVDTSDRREQRKFGITMAAAFAVVGLLRFGIRWLLHDAMPSPPTIFLSIAAVFLVLGLVWPGSLRPLFIAWMRLALGINWVMTRVLLTLAYGLLIIPTGFLVRIFGDDPLKREWLPDATTYWEEPEEQPDDPERYLKQF